METWSPLTVFCAAYVAAAVAAMGSACASTRPVTTRVIASAWLFWGPVGCGVPMVGYETFDCLKKPWRVIGVAIMVGAAVIRLSDVTAIVRRVLNLKEPVDAGDNKGS